jgi:chemotaxis protein MotB
MNARIILVLGLAGILVGTSCVSTKKYKAQSNKLESLTASFSKSQADLNACENAKSRYQEEINGLNKQITELNDQVEYFKKNNNQVLNQLENLAVISSAQAESIKKSMENIGQKDAYITGCKIHSRRRIPSTWCL